MKRNMNLDRFERVLLTVLAVLLLTVIAAQIGWLQ